MAVDEEDCSVFASEAFESSFFPVFDEQATKAIEANPTKRIVVIFFIF